VAVKFSAFAFDPDQRQLRRADLDVHLTPKAFDLLALLIHEAPRVVRKRQLHEQLWPETFVADATLVGLIKELRRALGDSDRQAPMIRTAHGVGYAFAAVIERPTPRSPEVSRWIVAGGRRIPLQRGENLIGRDPTSLICLDVAGVSRRHARIVVGETDALLEDLGSKNGTSLADEPVRGSTALRDGDRVHIGPIVVVFHESTSGISTETVAMRRPLSRIT